MPIPKGTRAVSPCTMSIWPASMPMSDETTWAKVVSWPWPWLWLPVKTEIDPVALTRIVALS